MPRPLDVSPSLSIVFLPFISARTDENTPCYAILSFVRSSPSSPKSSSPFHSVLCRHYHAFTILNTSHITFILIVIFLLFGPALRPLGALYFSHVYLFAVNTHIPVRCPPHIFLHTLQFLLCTLQCFERVSVANKFLLSIIVQSHIEPRK